MLITGDITLKVISIIIRSHHILTGLLIIGTTATIAFTAHLVITITTTMDAVIAVLLILTILLTPLLLITMEIVTITCLMTVTTIAMGTIHTQAIPIRFILTKRYLI